MDFLTYEEVPRELAARILEEQKQAKAAAPRTLSGARRGVVYFSLGSGRNRTRDFPHHAQEYRVTRLGLGHRRLELLR